MRIERTTIVAPELRGQLAAAAPPVFAALLASSSPPALVHRDFYDQQVFVADNGLDWAVGFRNAGVS